MRPFSERVGCEAVGRTKEFDEGEVLDGALDLCWRQAYKATSVRDLVAATEVAESSLYNCYGGKRGLFLVALARYRKMLSRYLKRLAEFESPAAGLRWMFDGVAKGLASQSDFRGCMITNTTIELAPHDAELQAELRSIYREVEDVFCRVLKKAAQRGELAESRPPRALARYLMQNLEGLRVLAKSDPGARTLRGMANTTLALVLKVHTTASARRSPSRGRAAARRQGE